MKYVSQNIGALIGNKAELEPITRLSLGGEHLFCSTDPPPSPWLGP